MIPLAQGELLQFPEPDRDLPAVQDQQAAAEALMLERIQGVARHWSPQFRARVRGVLRAMDERDHEHTAREVLAFLNSKRPGKLGYRPTEANLRLICARLAEGATLAECKGVISRKWQDTQRVRPDGRPVFDPLYLRPATLFRASNFAQYLGELGTAP